MKEILLPFDFSPYAKRALDLAMQGFPFGAATQVTLLHVIDERLYQRVMPTGKVPSIDEIASFLHDEIEQARATIGGAKSVQVRTEVSNGAVVPTIAEHLRSARFDGVLIGGKGHGGASEIVLGTTARRVVRQTTVPTYVIKRPTQRGLPKTALCAVDTTRRLGAGLVMAASLVHDFGLVVDTLSVVPHQLWPYSQYVASELRVEAELRAEEAKLLAAYEVEILNKLVSAARHVDYGSVPRAILRHGESHDLIVLTTVQQAHVGRSLLGSTIEDVLTAASADVLIAR